MTSDGTGSDRAGTRSAGGPPSRIASIRSSTICWMRGRRPCTRRAVNSPMTARRAAVWSGGSMPISDAPRLRTRRSAGVSGGRGVPAGGAGRFCGIGNDGSERSAVNPGADSAARASSSRVTSQVSDPPGSSAVARPGAPRRRSYSGGTRKGHARGSGRLTSGRSSIDTSHGSGLAGQYAGTTGPRLVRALSAYSLAARSPASPLPVSITGRRPASRGCAGLAPARTPG